MEMTAVEIQPEYITSTTWDNHIADLRSRMHLGDKKTLWKRFCSVQTRGLFQQCVSISVWTRATICLRLSKEARLWCIFMHGCGASLCMVVHGCGTSLCMVVHGCGTSLCMVVHGCAWLNFKSWLRLKTNGICVQQIQSTATVSLTVVAFTG
jgi:hypothetical protein